MALFAKKSGPGLIQQAIAGFQASIASLKQGIKLCQERKQEINGQICDLTMERETLNVTQTQAQSAVEKLEDLIGVKPVDLKESPSIEGAVIQSQASA